MSPSTHPSICPSINKFISAFVLFIWRCCNSYDMASNVGCVLNSEVEEIFEKKESWHNLRRQPDICMQKLSKTTNLSVGTAGLPA